MKRPRVLTIEFNEDNTVGGSHQVMYDLATHLSPNKFEPVSAFRQNNMFAKMLEEKGCEVHVFESQRKRELELLTSSSRLKRFQGRMYALRWRLAFLRKQRIDLVLINNTPNFGYNTWLPMCHFLGIPCWSNAMGEVFPVRTPLQKKLFRSFGKVLAISQQMKQESLEAGIPEDRIDVFHLSVDLDAFRAKLQHSPEHVRKDLGVPEHQLLAVMVGNIREWKGQHVVLEALAKLLPEVQKQIVVAFVGAVSIDDAPYKARLDQHVAEWSLGESVRFLGSRRDVPDLFRAADIALHASTTPEPFGLVVPEAMSVGTPVIGTSIGGPGEVITPQSGLTFDPKYPDELARCIQSLVEDKELRDSLSEGAARRAEDFSLDRYVAHIEKLYEKALFF